MASALPLVCRAAEPLTLPTPRRSPPVSLRPVAMLVRGLAVIAGLGLPVAAATLADLAHPATAVSPGR
ncbi:hypothetical protein [Methylobacterium aquaticum]|uniref:hypothetical protein n=1 Tax=Methylobacterium aquaticum TaxID=270351 RepID=UPI0019321A13|nr:hypothetical protein [Methylobacterium aquaticum]QRE76067.1 hypothetical protein F1D61_23115 [Methylobacterium aquaticum]